VYFRPGFRPEKVDFKAVSEGRRFYRYGPANKTVFGPGYGDFFRTTRLSGPTKAGAGRQFFLFISGEFTIILRNNIDKID
jgi:hypothetical protein